MTASVAVQRDSAEATLSGAWQLGCTGRSPEALALAMGVWEEARAKRDIRLEAQASIDIAWYDFQLGQAEQGLSHARRAVQLAAGLCEAAWEAKARALQAWLFGELGFSENAVDEALRALRQAEQAGDARVLCFATNVVGVVFWLTRQPDRAVEFCDRAVAMARRIGDPVLLEWWLINLGGSWAEMAYAARGRGDTASFESAMQTAHEMTEEARQLAESSGDSWGLRLCLGNMAEYFVATGDYSAAKSRLDAYAAVKGGDYERGREQYFYTLGQTLIHLGQVDEAILHLLDSIEIAERTSNIDTVVHAAGYLADAYERKGEYRLALDYHRRYHAAYVKMSAENAQRRARLAEILYESDKLRSIADSESRRAHEMAQSYEVLKQKSAELAEAAFKDPLTGLFNRRRFDSVLAEFKAAGFTYAVALVDIDHFKKINDGFSHMVGDQVLREIGGLLQSALRGEDLAVRYGGEEFALLLKGTSAVSGHDVCNRLREAIAAWDWSGIATGLRVTASIGIADDREAPDTAALLRLADFRLYAAKGAGRNRVISTGSDHAEAAEDCAGDLQLPL